MRTSLKLGALIGLSALVLLMGCGPGGANPFRDDSPPTNEELLEAYQAFWTQVVVPDHAPDVRFYDLESIMQWKGVSRGTGIGTVVTKPVSIEARFKSPGTVVCDNGRVIPFAVQEGRNASGGPPWPIEVGTSSRCTTVIRMERVNEGWLVHVSPHWSYLVKR